MEQSESYIITDDESKTIYLWKGNSCSVRSKFIGASKSQELRGQVGMHYRVIPIDAGDEPTELLDRIDESPAKGFAKEIREENDLKFDVPGVNAPTAPESKSIPKSRNIPSKLQQPKGGFNRSVSGGGDADGAKRVTSSASNGPLYTGQRTQNQIDSQVQYDFKKVMETLETLEIPDGYEREMVIIGNQAFSIIEKKVSFLGTTKFEKSMEKISSLPEGVFFAKGYAPRVLCENQKILAIEFLKKENLKQRSKDPKKLKPLTKNPKDLAKSFGMKVD
ncbi:MAG: hypothetical protein ACTSWY_04400 [Promethearchaeota archaeon]